MKKIKKTNLDPDKMYTKSEYARKIKTNPMDVKRMVDNGKLTVVICHGAELIHL